MQEAIPTPEGIRSAITAGVLTVSKVLPLTEAELEGCVQRVLRKRSLKRPAHYAFVTGRNWAISRLRKADVAARRTVQAAAQRAQAEHAAAQRAVLIAELQEIIQELAAEHVDDAGKLRQLGCVRLYYVESAAPGVWRDRFPGVSRDALYQWKRRGMLLVMAYASEPLELFLEQHKLRAAAHA